jgi:hypothetical protein
MHVTNVTAIPLLPPLLCLDIDRTPVAPSDGARSTVVLRPPFAVFCCRRYGTKCGGCSQGISPSDLVRKARDKVFHLNCFTCMVCRKQLSTGEELYVLDDNKFICKEDYISGKTHQGNVLPSQFFQFSIQPNVRQK